jgi:UDP-N-acetylmuramoyl-L-alanyl-D-glutamate--2,6-diaminopimelate ligase
MSARGDWREGLPAGADRSDLPSEVRAVQFDSRDVQPGDLFVCVVGARADGHDFASAAVDAGAVALVAQQGRGEPLRALSVPVVEVADSRRALSSIAAAHEGFPARRLTVVGITGTDGKSTTCYLAAAALEGCRVPSGMITTIGSRVDGRDVPNPTRLTTQEAPYIQGLFAEMVEAGCTHVVVEATSHGLDMLRLADCEFDIAVFTNLSPDHLDFHGTFEAYRAAKLHLFEMLDAPTTKQVQRVAVVNTDNSEGRHFADASRAPLLTYGVDGRADVNATDVQLWSDGATFALEIGDETIDASVRLSGDFNVANATAALATVQALGLDVMLAAGGVATCEGVPGRMQRVAGAPFDVVVDYAHTPEGMRHALAALAEVVEGRVIVVFGCAGERSPDRRSGLGAVVAELAGFAVLTEEDPRSEDPDAIIDQIAHAMTIAGASEGDRFERVRERREAIDRAFELARPGDLVLLAGKGHESSIERADETIEWDEHAVAVELIAARFG